MLAAFDRSESIRVPGAGGAVHGRSGRAHRESGARRRPASCGDTRGSEPCGPCRATERGGLEETKGLRVSETLVILDAQNPFRKNGPVRSGSSLLHEIRLAGLEPGRRGGPGAGPGRRCGNRTRSPGVPPPRELGELEVFARFQSHVGTRSARRRAVGRRETGLRRGGSFPDTVAATWPPDRGRALDSAIPRGDPREVAGLSRAGPSSLLVEDRPSDSTLLCGGSA